MFRYFTKANTNRYVDVLDDLVRSYNTTHHSAIKMAPSAVDSHNERAVYNRLYDDSVARQRQSLRSSKFKLSVGDSVRILESKRVFRRGYLPHWSEEIYFVKYRHATSPHTFTTRDFLAKLFSASSMRPNCKRLNRRAKRKFTKLNA